MERLTDKKEADAQRREYEIRIKQGYPRNIPEERFLRLAAYEDTGLEPEEISKIREDVENGYLKSTARRYGVPVGRLRELVQADREGRCVVFAPGYPVVSAPHRGCDYCGWGERIETVLPKSDAKDESLEADHD